MNDFPPRANSLDLGKYSLGRAETPFMILGPCVIESEELTLEVAQELVRIHEVTGIPVIFKASFDKANRTSIESFRGPGLDRGLEILARVREKSGLPIISDIHSPDQASKAAEVLDVIQIPAFLCRQTDLLVAAGETGKAVNIKKGQFQSPDDMLNAAKKVLSTGNDRILLTERGSSFGYGDLVVDMRSIVRMKRFGFPVVFDATHSAQFPGRGEGRSAGDRTLVPHLARAGIAAGADGIFMEVHPNPEGALCDGPNSLYLKDLEPLARNLVEIFRLVPHEESPVAEAEHAVGDRGPESTSLEDRLKKIRLIVLDVDGALTDGGIVFGSGGLEIKTFNVRDGHGIKIAKRLGLDLAVVTGRTSEVVQRRAEELGITKVYQRIRDKRIVLEELLEEFDLGPHEIAVLGDDVVDIPLFRRVGAAFAVRESPREVCREAHYVTSHAGGHGAAREMIEMILKAQGKWESALARYYE
jgi:2-dehydro-3-deoxyphosphooctonate aldolase (KDO 8-P synthase)